MMTASQNRHAHRVVEHFRRLLDDRGADCLSAEEYEELALLVESAIDAAVVEKLEQIATRLDTLAHEVRRDAERFDPIT